VNEDCTSTDDVHLLLEVVMISDSFLSRTT